MKKTRVVIKVPKVTVERFGKDHDDEWGYCVKADHEIHLEKRIPARLAAEVIVHEHLHVAFPDATEHRVNTIARNIGNVLWKQGFRKPK